MLDITLFRHVKGSVSPDLCSFIRFITCCRPESADVQRNGLWNEFNIQNYASNNVPVVHEFKCFSVTGEPNLGKPGIYFAKRKTSVKSVHLAPNPMQISAWGPIHIDRLRLHPWLHLCLQASKETRRKRRCSVWMDPEPLSLIITIFHEAWVT